MSVEKVGQKQSVPIHMHLHASHEPSASIGSHMSHAVALGIRHLWLTEHDTRMGQKGKGGLYTFAFSSKSLYNEEVCAGFIEDEDNNGHFSFLQDEKGIVLCLQSNVNERESVSFQSKGKRHCDALFSRLIIEIDADMVAANPNSSAIVEFVLSAQPPSYKQAKLRYILGAAIDEETDEPKQILPMPKKENGKYYFPITKDVKEKVGGLDNAFCGLRLIAVNGAEIAFRSFTVHRELNFQQVWEEQVKVAQKASKKWGVTPFVAFEVTGAGHHKNCFSTKVPVIDYIAREFKVSNADAIAHIKAYSGIFSWNHPFTETPGKGLSLKERDTIVDACADRLIKERVYGATLLEVGFPEGRDGFFLHHYLRLWDRLSLAGIFITGDGDSDNHHAVPSGWTEGNNFCTYARITKDEKPTEEAFVQAFKRGDVWMGNPVVMRDCELSVKCKGQEMGGVCVGERALVSFKATGILCDGYARIIVNGEEVKRMVIVDGSVYGSALLSAKQRYNFARVEIYSFDDTAIALTNPIYLVKTTEDIPPEAIENGRRKV